MNDDQHPVGPVDVLALLEDIKSGKAGPRTADVEICVDPMLIERADAVYDKIEELRAAVAAEAAEGERSIGEAAPERAEELAALEAEHDELYARYQLSLVTFTFRGQSIGDASAVTGAMAAAGEDPNDLEVASIYGTSQYMVAPTRMTPQEVRRMVPVIGWQQYSKMCEAWQILVFGQPQAPLSRKRSPIPETAKR